MYGMANRFSLSADVQATIDEASAERAGEQLGETMEQQIGDLQAGIGGVEGGGGVGGIGGARGGGGGGVALQGAGALGLRSALGGGGAATGAAAGALTKVALGGAIGFGILQGVQRLAQASPSLQQTTSLLGEAMDLFFRPFGNFLGDALRPLAESLTTAAIGLNKSITSKGLVVGGVSSLLDLVNNLPGELGKIFAQNLGTGLEFLFGDNEFFDALQRFQWDWFIPIVKWDDVVGGFGDAITNAWPGWPNVQGLWPGWPNLDVPSGFWPTIGAPGVIDTTFGAADIDGDDVLDPLFGGIEIDADDILSEFSFGGDGDQGDTADTRDRRDTTRDTTFGDTGGSGSDFQYSGPGGIAGGGGTSDELRELRRIRDALSNLDPDINLELPEDFDPLT